MLLFLADTLELIVKLPVEHEPLKESKLGKAASDLKSSPEEAVAKAASKLIEAWRARLLSSGGEQHTHSVLTQQ